MSVPGVCPIGALIPWCKSMSGIPSLAAQGRTEWVEGNGQVDTDPNSATSGKTLPSVNGGQTRFIRGNSTSGTLAGSTDHTHTVTYATLSLTGSTGSPVVTSVNTPTGVESIQPVQSFDAVHIFRNK